MDFTHERGHISTDVNEICDVVLCRQHLSLISSLHRAEKSRRLADDYRTVAYSQSNFINYRGTMTQIIRQVRNLARLRDNISYVI